jgi:hypothetical protein
MVKLKSGRCYGDTIVDARSRYVHLPIKELGLQLCRALLGASMSAVSSLAYHKFFVLSALSRLHVRLSLKSS